MSRDGGQKAAPRGRWGLDVLGLLVLAGWLAGVGLGEAALVDPDEPRSALVARLMVERGDWLAPHLPAVFHHDYPGDPLEGDLLAYWDKPPLFFWLEALAMTALGPTALAARLPAALAQVATVLLVYACGRFLGGRRAGLLAGVVAATAPQLFVMGHVARMETLLVALMTAMLLAVLRLVHDRPRSWGWVLVLYVSAGLAVLTKGPVAVVLPAVAVGATCLVSGRWGDLGRLRPLAGAAIVLLIAAPWYVYMHLRYPPGQGVGGAGFAYAYFVGQHLLRATTEGFGHYEHVPGYLVGILMLGFLPWSVFLPGACAQVGRAGWRERRDRPAVVLVLAWAVAVVGAFSLSTTQLEHYVMPAVPAVAVLTGAYLADRTRPEDRNLLFRIGLWVTLVSGVGAIVAMVAALVSEGLWRTAHVAPVVVTAAISVAGLVQLVRGRRLAAVGLAA
ncbi:MAG: glycosyltransferase family 39 protein, partial [Planctomycetes bacterium]|nr:glycosyltransferase family 39 protein [Planctomycetota bacterium]